MIATETLPLMKPKRLSWLCRILSLATGPGLALLWLTLPWCALGADEQTFFAAPQDAVNALVAAATNHDTNAIHLIFGPVGHELISPDVVQATEEYKLFVQTKSFVEFVVVFFNATYDTTNYNIRYDCH